MSEERERLAQLCLRFDYNAEMKEIRKMEREGVIQFRSIRKEACQWMDELLQQVSAMHTENKNRPIPLLPQTPTLTRKMRKRKIPAVEDPEKENSAAVTRGRRAASQAANMKFQEQLNTHITKKMRRPSSPKVPEKKVINNKKGLRGKKRLRIATDATSDDEMPDSSTLSMASTTSSVTTRMQTRNNETSAKESMTSNASIDVDVITKKKRTKRVKVLPTVNDESSIDGNSPMIRTRLRNMRKRQEESRNVEKITKDDKSATKTADLMSNVKPPGKKYEGDTNLKTKQTTKASPEEQTSNAEESSDEETPSKVIQSEENVATVKKQLKVIPAAKRTLDDDQSKGRVVEVTHGEQIDEEAINTDVAVSGDVVEIMETHAFEHKHLTVHLTRLSDRIQDTVLVTPQGTIVYNFITKSDSEEQVEEINLEIPGPSNIKTPIRALTGLADDLAALTPHLTGMVKKRVKEVEEKSMKKDEPQTKVFHKQDKASNMATVNVSEDEFESAESSVDETELPESPTFAPIKEASTSTVMKVEQIRVSAKKSPSKKRSPSIPAGKLKVRLFSEETLRKRSKSCENFSTVGQGKPVSAQPRSRVLTGIQTFIKPNAREMAATAAAEEEKQRKAEESKKNFERLQEAAKKKEEQMKLKKEQKKKENEEKKLRVQMALEEKQRIREEKARIEKQKEELKAQMIKKREEMAFAEREARLERQKLKHAECEQRRKEEEARLKPKELAVQEQSKREDERIKVVQSSAIPIVKGKNTAKVPTKTQLNETFEITSKTLNTTATKQNPSQPIHVPKQQKPQNKVTIKSIASTVTSYAMTPSRDEMPPELPKDSNNYGIDEVAEDDPSDDDEKPKKVVPLWARNLKFNMQLDIADYVSIGLRNRLFGTRVFKPSAEELFGANSRSVGRRSSAVWNTPPNVHHVSMCASFMEGHESFFGVH